MAPGFATPTHLLLILAMLAVFFGLRALSRDDAQKAGSVQGRKVLRLVGGLRVKKPTRKQAHMAWLCTSALVAFAFTRAAALPLFLVIFFAVWLGGFGLLARHYR